MSKSIAIGVLGAGAMLFAIFPTGSSPFQSSDEPSSVAGFAPGNSNTR